MTDLGSTRRAAEVDIYNTALGQLGKATVADLSTASLAQSGAATQLKRVANSSLETVLARHGWLCALNYDWLEPAVLANDTNWKYRTRYQLPAGALRVWEVRTPGEASFLTEINLASFGLFGTPLIEGEAWETNRIDNGDGATLVLRTNLQCGVAVAWVRKCSYAALDPHVADAVAFDMAARVARNVTGDEGTAKGLEAKAEQKVLLAISVDSTQQGGQAPLVHQTMARIRDISR